MTKKWIVTYSIDKQVDRWTNRPLYEPPKRAEPDEHGNRAGRRAWKRRRRARRRGVAA